MEIQLDNMFSSTLNKPVQSYFSGNTRNGDRQGEGEEMLSLDTYQELQHTIYDIVGNRNSERQWKGR